MSLYGQFAQQCLNNCGFYGSPDFDGYCSKCYKNIISTQPPPSTQNLYKVALTDDRFNNLCKEITSLTKEELTPKKLEVKLANVYLTAKQAKDLISSMKKISYFQNYFDFIFEHVVYARVLDRHNLKEGFGVEGYYYTEEGVHPPDNYQVWNHQRSFMW